MVAIKSAKQEFEKLEAVGDHKERLCLLIASEMRVAKGRVSTLEDVQENRTAKIAEMIDMHSKASQSQPLVSGRASASAASGKGNKSGGLTAAS